MIRYIYTIGFTQKSAQTFFHLIQINSIDIVVDIRLKNTSQLAGFAKYPDISYFLKNICSVEYLHDALFAPRAETLAKYKKKTITWDQYVQEFNQTMDDRKINDYIASTYGVQKKICLLCSEVTAEKCHRSLVADRFKRIFNDVTIINL